MQIFGPIFSRKSAMDLGDPGTAPPPTAGLSPELTTQVEACGYVTRGRPHFNVAERNQIEWVKPFAKVKTFATRRAPRLRGDAGGLGGLVFGDEASEGFADGGDIAV